MSRAEIEIEKLQQAISILESQRQALGDEVIEAALEPMRAKLASLQAAVLGEQRKLVTVLFADLAGHTQLFSHLDSEDVREVLTTYFAAWKDTIQKHGGVVEKFIGDAVMAVFGLPATQEDDAERAVQAALEMRRRLQALNRDFEQAWEARLAMRVGITTGEVVVGSLGERQAGEFVVVGETVNLAARLQAAAPQDGILISHSTYRFVRGIFSVRSLEPIRVKGAAQPIQVYLVNAAKPRTFRIPTRGVEGVETRMIGREVDLARLKEAFREAQEDRRCQVVVVAGEAGVGKSRLIYEFGNWLDLLPETVFYFKGRAYAATRNIPYSLLQSIFAHRFQIIDSDPPDLVWEKLARGVAGVLGDDDASDRKARFIGGLLGFKPAGDGQAEEAVDPRRLHDQALAYLGEYFRTLAQQAPVVVMLEDIHWADDSSLDLVHWMDGSLANTSMLVICTSRPGLYERRPNWGEGLHFYHRLDLHPLTRRDSRRLVEEILQRVESVPAALQDLMVDRAEGNPFYIEEGIKILIEEGVIEKTGERWRVHMHRLEVAKIPATLTGVLQARLDALAPHQRSLLQRAAVIGRAFWDHAVDYLGGQAQAGLHGSSASAQEVLNELRSREIVFQRERSSFEDTREYLFKHILMRDVAYESLLKRQRREYHGRAAGWLEQATHRSQRAEAYAQFIAQHWEQAGEPELAARWYRRAGSHAASRYANAEAMYAFTKALDLIPADQSGPRFELLLERERILDRQGDRLRQAQDVDLLEQLGKAIDDTAARTEAALRRANYAFNTGSYEAAATAAQQAVTLAHQAGSVEKEAEGYQKWALALDFQLTRPETLEKLEQALKLARQAGHARLEADVLLSLGPHFSDLNRYEEARTYLSPALEIHRRLGDRFGEARALSNLGVTFWGEGRYSEAKGYFESALQLMQEIGERRGEGILLGNLGVIAHEQLDYEASRRYHLQALEINREIHNQHSCCINLGNLAEAERDLGDFTQAQGHYEQASRLAQELGLVQNHSAILNSLSLLKEYLKDIEGAFELAQQGLELARQANSPMYTSEGLSRLGQTLLVLGRYEESRIHFQEALQLQRELGLENRALESMAGLARVDLASGDVKAAHRRVEEILGHLPDGDLLGSEEPSRVYLTCCQVLQAYGDPRFAAVLARGCRYVHERAASIQEPHLRQAFLERIPWNNALLGMHA